MIRVLEALFPGVKIYLFGSRAWGPENSVADIDLAIDIGRKLTIFELGRARRVMTEISMVLKIDLVDIWSIPEVLRNKILQKGVIWKN
jgi:predicted nucleotidyltransferase